MINFLLGFVSSMCLAFVVYNKLSEQDMEIMLEQNELMLMQQQIIEDIENDRHLIFKKFITAISDYINNKSDIGSLIKDLSSMEINLITKTNYLQKFY